MNLLDLDFNKSEMVKKALENRTGIFVPSDDIDVQCFWKRIASITPFVNISGADNKIYSLSILKIEGYDFLEDILEELQFLEYILLQVKNLNSNVFEMPFSPQNENISTVEYIEYNAKKYNEIETNIINYGTVTSGILKIKVNINPLVKIYNRLSFTTGGERMETTITNITDSNVVMGNSNQISDSFNTNRVESLPEEIIKLLNSEKEDLLKIGITENEINDLINEPTENKIEKFNKKLLPHIGTAAKLATLVASLAQLIS